MTSIQETVELTARSLGLVNSGGELRTLDSLDMIDLVVALEQASGIQLPASSLREECFESLESITELLDQFAPR